MRLNEPKSFAIKLSTTQLTAPTGANSVTLFDSTVAFGAKQIRHLPIKRLSFGAEHDQAGTLLFKISSDGGTNWDTYESRSVSAPAANTTSGPFDYLIDTFDDVQLIWTNGGVTQGTWRPTLRGHEDRGPGN